jgi:hypothetical protein
MKITRSQLRRLIKESIYGSRKYKPAPIDPMTKISTGGETYVSRIPDAYRRQLDSLASDPSTSSMADVMAPTLQTPDLVIPFEGDSYEEEAFKGDSYDDELKKYHKSNPTAFAASIKKEINKHIPNLEKVLDREIGSKISSSSQLSYDWSFPHDGVVVKVDSNIITLEDMALIAAEALFGTSSAKYQKSKSLMPYELYYSIATEYLINTGFTKAENDSIFNATNSSFAAYIAYKAITEECQANFGAEYIGASYSNIGYRDHDEAQELGFSNSDQLGPAIFNAAKSFDNITINGEKILRNARVTLK